MNLTTGEEREDELPPAHGAEVGHKGGGHAGRASVPWQSPLFVLTLSQISKLNSTWALSSKTARRSELMSRAPSQRTFFWLLFCPSVLKLHTEKCLFAFHPRHEMLLIFPLLVPSSNVCYLQTMDAPSKTPCDCSSCHSSHPPAPLPSPKPHITHLCSPQNAGATPNLEFLVTAKWFTL